MRLPITTTMLRKMVGYAQCVVAAGRELHSRGYRRLPYFIPRML